MKSLAIVIVFFLLMSGFSEGADKVRMSISAVDVSFLTAGLALKRGMFRDEGLDVELIRMNANVSITRRWPLAISITPWCSPRWCAARCAACR